MEILTEPLKPTTPELEKDVKDISPEHRKLLWEVVRLIGRDGPLDVMTTLHNAFLVCGAKVPESQPLAKKIILLGAKEMKHAYYGLERRYTNLTKNMKRTEESAEISYIQSVRQLIGGIPKTALHRRRLSIPPEIYEGFVRELATEKKRTPEDLEHDPETTEDGYENVLFDGDIICLETGEDSDDE